MSLIRNLLLAGALVSLVAGCKPADEYAAATEAEQHDSPATHETEPAVIASVGELDIRGAYATILPAVGAVYLEVVNRSDAADWLIAIESTSAAAAETHESVDDSGVMRMISRPEGFEVPASGTLVLEPSGKHIMLVSPQSPLEGDRVHLRLEFEHAGTVEFEVAVDSGHEGMDHGAMDHSMMDHGSSDGDEAAHEAMEHGSTEHGSMDH